MDCHLLRPAGHITKPCLDCLFQMPFPPALKSRSQWQGHRQWVTNLLMTEELLMDLPSYGAELLGRGLTKKGEQKGIFKLWFFGQMNTTTNKGRSGFGWFESKHFFFPLQIEKHRDIFYSLCFAFSMQSATKFYVFVKYVLQLPFPSVSIALA